MYRCCQWARACLENMAGLPRSEDYGLLLGASHGRRLRLVLSNWGGSLRPRKERPHELREHKAISFLLGLGDAGATCVWWTDPKPCPIHEKDSPCIHYSPKRLLSIGRFRTQWDCAKALFRVSTAHPCGTHLIYSITIESWSHERGC